MAPLEQLPEHILEAICEYVAYGEPDRTGLFELSLVSAALARATEKERFERISFHITNRDQFHDDLEQCSAIFAAHDGRRFKYLRRIKLNGNLPIGLDDYYEQRIYKTPHEYATLIDWNPDSHNYLDPDKVVLSGMHIRCRSVLNQAQQETEDEAWRPFVSFLQQVTGLTDLIYLCIDHIPKSILDQLKESHYSSRLHVRMVDMASFKYNAGQEAQYIDAIVKHLFDILTSPCLYSLLFTYDTRGRSFTMAAICDAVALSLAPRLKHVWLRSIQYVFTYFDSQIRQDDPPWPGFPCQSKTQARPLAKLDSLAVDGRDNVDLVLNKWYPVIDFSHLKSLQISRPMEPSILRLLVGLAQNDKLLGIRRISCAGTPTPLDLLHNNDEDFVNIIQLSNPMLTNTEDDDRLLSMLFESLNSLEEIVFQGPISNGTFDAIMRKHATSLRAFSFGEPGRHYEVWRNDMMYQINELGRHCKNLRSLKVWMQRSRGDATEVSIYRALAQLPKLYHLGIVYLIVAGDAMREGFSDRTRSARVQFEVRNYLVDAAIDSELVWGVFQILHDGQVRNSQYDQSPLRILGIQPVLWDGPEMIVNRIKGFQLAALLCDSMVCLQVDLGSDQHGASMRGNEGNYADRYRQLGWSFDPDGDYGIVGRIWKQLWPGDEDWMNNWHSFPLTST